MNSVQVPREYISLIYIPLKVKNGRDIPLQAAYAMRKSNAATTHLFKLQAAQNFASRIISNTRKFDNVTQILIDLRWLPVKSQLYYRDAVLAFKSMSGLMPPYLASLFLKYVVLSLEIPTFLMFHVLRALQDKRLFYVGQFRY